MRHFLTILFSGCFLVVINTGCSSEPETISNPYLGDIPSLEKQYAGKIEAKEADIKANKDLETAFKLGKELEELKDAYKAAIEAYTTAHPLITPLPFQPLPDTPYTTKEIVVNRATAGNLNLKFTVNINEDLKNKYGSPEKMLFIYFKAVDSQGNDIPKSITVATNARTAPLTAGTVYEAFGSWQSKSLRHMEDFARLVEVTREDYDRR
ncbi:MAG: hypothetical protein K9N22_10530 [Candidatus Marinimicrobia bacterium]|nr:hypothetical protein [Candidatus Neomarinimicrobiota bacterium]MCF7903118.1 hypothetical protein [Candidatus Neomarinimicrobiota bacterium]